MNKFGPYQLVDNLKSTPIIGDIYYVRSVLARFEDGILYNVPIRGPVRNDVELIGFPHDHVHYDHRFTPDEMYRQMISSEHRPEIRVVTYRNRKDESLKPFRCRRTFQLFETQPFHIALECVKEHEIMHNFRCPHWGIDLRSEVVIKGIVQCPLHGLLFDVQTNRLVKRYHSLDQITTHGLGSGVLPDCDLLSGGVGKK